MLFQDSDECSAYIGKNWDNNDWKCDDSNAQKSNGVKAHPEKKGYYIYITILYIFVMVTTCQRFRTEAYNIKQEGPEANPTKAKQNKENRNTRTRKQWNTELPESKR